MHTPVLIIRRGHQSAIRNQSSLVVSQSFVLRRTPMEAFGLPKLSLQSLIFISLWLQLEEGYIARLTIFQHPRSFYREPNIDAEQEENGGDSEAYGNGNSIPFHKGIRVDKLWCLSVGWGERRSWRRGLGSHSLPTAPSCMDVFNAVPMRMKPRQEEYFETIPSLPARFAF